MKKDDFPVPEEVIANKIILLRNRKVMLDSDLAELYKVETKRLNEQVKRNIERFPEDFMFKLSKEEWSLLKSQFATSSWGGRRSEPYAFTEHGVLMLSSVLNSSQAIAVNIRIMRVYTKLKKMLITHQDLLLRMEEIEKKVSGQDDQIMTIFKYVKKFVMEESKPKIKIGFKK